MGARHLRRRRRRPQLLPDLSPEHQPGRGSTAGRHPAISAEEEARADESLQQIDSRADAANGLVKVGYPPSRQTCRKDGSDESNPKIFLSKSFFNGPAGCVGKIYPWLAPFYTVPAGRLHTGAVVLLPPGPWSRALLRRLQSTPGKWNL